MKIEFNKKQSSVEWLFFQINTSFVRYDSGYIRYIQLLEEISSHKKQAKEMHRQEMVNFTFLYAGLLPDKLDIEKGYNETFNNHETI